MADLEAISASLNLLLSKYGVTRDQIADLLGGSADGGPGGDGGYPVTLANGTTALVPCPRRLALLTGNVDGAVAALQPILAAANAAKSAAIAAADRAEQVINIEPARGGWINPVVDASGRIVAGFHPLLGSYDARRTELEARIRMVELGGVEMITRRGGWIRCTVDINGRVTEGMHEVLGRYPFNAGVGSETGNASWAAKLAELRGLRLRDAAPIHSAPPKVVRRTLTLPIITGPVEVINHDDPRLTFSLPMFPASPAGEVRAGWYKFADGTNYAPHFSLRFITDALKIEVRYGYPGQLRMLVDSQPVSIGATLDLADGEDDYPLICIDFGADVRTIKPSFTVSAAGAGYAEGDLITVAGAAGDPVQLEVTSVNANGSLRPRGFRVKSWGTLTALEAGEVAVAGGSGAGGTITLANAQGLTGHTTRRMRRIELVFAGQQSVIGDVRVPSGSTTRPWPLAGVRLMVIQDSYGQVYPDYPGGVWVQRMASLLGIEDVWINTIGGTGFTAGSIHYQTRLDDIMAHLPPAHQPFVFMAQGTINDTGAEVAEIRAAVLAFWTEAFERLPNDAVMIQTGMFRTPGVNPSDAQSAAVREGFTAACAVADPDGKRSFFMETRAPLAMMVVPEAMSEWIAGDLAHLTQDGHDYVAACNAPSLLRALQSLSI